MKIMRKKKDSRIEEGLHQISRAMNNNRWDRCISEVSEAKEQFSVP